MRAVKAVLFDFDGTVVDTYDLILSCLRFAVRDLLGVDYADEVLMRKVGQPLAVQMEDFAPDARTRDELCRVYRERNALVHDERIALFPGVEETLRELREAGMRLGIVTSKRHDATMRGLGVFGLQGMFDVVVGADDCEAHKPSPVPVVRAARLLGLDSSECAYVGDSPYDLQAGRGAGCFTVAALWGMFPEATLRSEGPDALARTFAELPGVMPAARAL